MHQPVRSICARFIVYRLLSLFVPKLETKLFLVPKLFLGEIPWKFQNQNHIQLKLQYMKFLLKSIFGKSSMKEDTHFFQLTVISC